jgi:RNA polymerase sigma-70 factor, ECF subfamily
VIRQLGLGDTVVVMSEAHSAVAQAFVPEMRNQALPALAAADERRFSQIVARNVDFIWRCLRRMGIPSVDVDDAVQQVFLVAAAKLATIVPGSERAFLFATASRIAANARRSVQRRHDAIDHLRQAETWDSPTQEELSDQLRARLLLDRILSEMTAELREVFVLFELEELAVAEVAELLAIPIGTVGSRLRRAREEFHERARRLKSVGMHGRGR